MLRRIEGTTDEQIHTHDRIERIQESYSTTADTVRGLEVRGLISPPTPGSELPLTPGPWWGRRRFEGEKRD